MIKKIFCFLLITISCFAQSVGEDNNRFALSLFSQIDEKEENLALSPYSIFSNLALLYFGAEGQTAREIKNTLHISATDEQFLSAFKKQFTGLTQEFPGSNAKDDDGAYKLYVANGLFPSTKIELQSDFKDIAQNNFEATVQSTDYDNPEVARKEINRWIAKKTKGKIPELLESADIDSSERLIIANAAYFQGNWTYPFSPKMNYVATFTPENSAPVKVDMMQQNHFLPYFENEEVQCLLLPFEREGISQPFLQCAILLPKKDLKSLEETLTLEKLSQWLKESNDGKFMEVHLPKFCFSKRLVLNDSLKQLGMKEAFSPKADFSKISGERNLLLNKVLHETYFSLNEKGVTAASATTSHVGVTSGVPHIDPLTPFIADHPFLFLIFDAHSDAIVFMGHLTNPLVGVCNESSNSNG